MIISKIKNRYEKYKDSVSYWRKQGVTIGEKCEIYGTANFGSEPYLISIGNHVRINAGVNFVTHDGGVWVLREYLNDEKIDMFGRIQVGDNVHIGTNAIIMPNVKIGSNVIVGCGAIVTKDIPDNSIAVGVPARVIETLDEYVEKHRQDFEYTKLMTSEEKKAYLLNKEKYI